MILFPYSNKSESARALREVLGIKFVKPKSKYKGGVVINWGNAKYPSCPAPYKIINKPESVALAINKIKTFEVFNEKQVPTVPFTTSKEVAQDWLSKEKVVLARTAHGHSGSGITVVTPDSVLPDAAFYTAYVKKKKEFRVHVFNGKVIDVVQKRKSSKHEAPDPFIRSHKNGWVFCREGIEEPAGLRDIALLAVNALTLDFGAVDIIWNAKKNQCYALEVNTAPGIEGTTLEGYANEIQALAK